MYHYICINANVKMFNLIIKKQNEGDSMKGDSMKGDSMKGDSMKGDSMKGDSMKGDSMSRRETKVAENKKGLKCT